MHLLLNSRRKMPASSKTTILLLVPLSWFATQGLRMTCHARPSLATWVLSRLTNEAVTTHTFSPSSMAQFTSSSLRVFESSLTTPILIQPFQSCPLLTKMTFRTRTPCMTKASVFPHLTIDWGTVNFQVPGRCKGAVLPAR